MVIILDHRNHNDLVVKDICIQNRADFHSPLLSYLWDGITIGRNTIKNKSMKKSLFKILAKANRFLLPSYTKRQLDLSKASKLQLAIIGCRYFITANALD